MLKLNRFLPELAKWTSFMLQLNIFLQVFISQQYLDDIVGSSEVHA